MTFGCAVSSLESQSPWEQISPPHRCLAKGHHPSIILHGLENRLHYAATAWMKMESLHPKLSIRKTTSRMLSLLGITVILWSLNRDVLLHVQHWGKSRQTKSPDLWHLQSWFRAINYYIWVYFKLLPWTSLNKELNKELRKAVYNQLLWTGTRWIPLRTL